MTIGNPSDFAIESSITRAYARLSFRALGYFVIHIAGCRYGVHASDATMLACSLKEVDARISRRGTHAAPFATEFGGRIADALHVAIYAPEEEDKKVFGMSQVELCDFTYSRHLIWAPDGDEAFDDGSSVLQFDVGDRVRLINRQVYVNGNPLQEPYVRYTSSAHDAFRDEFPRLNLPVPGLEGGWWLEMKKLVEDGELIIPQGNYFVLGDNRDESLDSRYWGFVPQENVIGRPLLIYWSIRNEGQDIPLSPTPGDKLYHFVYAATHLLQMTRWDRTFRIVK